VGRETNRQRREKQAVTAREKAAAARAVQARVDQRRRARTILSSVVAVAVVIAVIAVVAINSGGAKNNPDGNRTGAASAIVNAVTGVASSTDDTVGQGNASLSAIKAISDAALTSDNKPELLFIGAEFCPFCAAERWSIINALSRFGTLSHLNQIRSATDDGNLATFSFYKSSYTSKYLSFVPVEDEDRSSQPLVSPTAAQMTIWKKYTSESFPFMDFGGKYVVTNAGYTDTDLSGLDWTQITNDLKDPTSTIAKDIVGEANILTKMICQLTNGQPATVCSAAGLSKITLPTASA
jgi:Domain of unknown function (DUF929)